MTRPPATLRDFYENPAVPVASGAARSRRQARLLARALGPVRTGAPPATILDIGCGDGSAAAVAAEVLTGHRLVGVDWSQDALRRARTRIPWAVRGELADGGCRSRPVPRTRSSSARSSSISSTPMPPWTNCAGCCAPAVI